MVSLTKHQFLNITCKLGNMKKPQQFVLYPTSAEDTAVTIQSDKRIARIDLDTGKGLLSDGKGGHQGHAKLFPAAGAMIIDAAHIIPELKKLLGRE